MRGKETRDTSHMRRELLAAAAALALVTGALVGGLPARALEMDRLKVQRKEVFEFTDKPKVTREGDKVAITFAVKDFCDATVAIENTDGKILRHLASGVLGANAPEPFQKNSLTQTVVWDGKDEIGRYIDDKDACTVRVSLGLSARFERTLFWAPEKATMDPKHWLGVRQLITAAKEGVYVYNGREVRLFDHDGEYVRTVFPPPRPRLGTIRGIDWAAYPPDDTKLPVKRGYAFNTFLTCSNPVYDKLWAISDSYMSLAGLASAMTLHGGRLFLVAHRLNRLPTGTTAEEVTLEGPCTSFPTTMRSDPPPYTPVVSQPISVAVSPDGKWLYMTGFPCSYGNVYGGYRWLHAVTRMPADGSEPAKPFIGELKQDGSGAGKDDSHFDMPLSVAVDPQGRLYIADYLNQRVQVFQPDGTLLNSIPAAYPTEVRVDPKTGEIYVFSWSHWVYRVVTGPRPVVNVEATLTRFGPLADPKKLVSWSLRDFIAGMGEMDNLCAGGVEIDFCADTPCIWLARRARANWGAMKFEQLNLLLLAAKDRKLAVKKDFSGAAQAKVVRIRPPRHERQRLYFNPGDGCLYVGEHYDPAPIHMKSFNEMVCIDPRTGRERLVRLPCTAEDIAFDMDGLACLRAGLGDSAEPQGGVLPRFDSRTWREVPFDYGEQFPSVSYQGYGEARCASAVVAPSTGNESSQLGGIAVSPLGRLAVACFNPGYMTPRQSEKNVQSTGVRKYEPRIFPGRSVESAIHVWDRHGKVLYDDALPGIGRTVSIGIDRDDNLYVLATAKRMYGPEPHPFSASLVLMKVKPGAAKLLASGGGRLVPIPLAPENRPKRPLDLSSTFGASWVENAQWTYGGVAQDGKGIGRCHCELTSQMSLDYFARSFVPEVHRYSVVILDSSGNTILRVGRYGNVDEGVPLIKEGGPSKPASVGGDEVTLFCPNFVAAETDRRFFIADVGNARILSVKLGYHAEEKVALKDVPDRVK